MTDFELAMEGYGDIHKRPLSDKLVESLFYGEKNPKRKLIKRALVQIVTCYKWLVEVLTSNVRIIMYDPRRPSGEQGDSR